MSALTDPMFALELDQSKSIRQLGHNIFHHNQLVCNRFRIDKLLSHGSFGVVYRAIDEAQSPQIEVAIKIEPLHVKHPLLRREHTVLKYLDRNLRHDELRYFPKTRGYVETTTLSITHTSPPSHIKIALLILDLLGSDMSNIKSSSNEQRMSYKSVMCFGRGALTALRQIHECGLIHQDVKPSNFCIRHGDEWNSDPHQICIIDFGLTVRSTSFNDREYHKHRFIGSNLYASRSAHDCRQLTYGDDLESLLYSMIMLYKGQLPWSICASVDHHRSLEELKKEYGGSMLTNHLQAPFRALSQHIDAILVNDHHHHHKDNDMMPDYDYLIDVFDREIHMIRMRLHVIPLSNYIHHYDDDDDDDGNDKTVCDYSKLTPLFEPHPPSTPPPKRRGRIEFRQYKY